MEYIFSWEKKTSTVYSSVYNPRYVKGHHIDTFSSQ